MFLCLLLVAFPTESLPTFFLNKTPLNPTVVRSEPLFWYNFNYVVGGDVVSFAFLSRQRRELRRSYSITLTTAIAVVGNTSFLYAGLLRFPEPRSIP